MVRQVTLQKDIEKALPKMSESQKKIAHYLLKNYDKAAFLTAAKLGKEVEVSESTIVRFANLLGYNGFPQLQEVLQDMVRKKLTTVNQLKRSITKVYKDKNVLYQILQSDLENLEITMNEISIQSFEKLISYIQEAEVIYIVGLRTAVAVAIFFYQALRLFLSNVRCINYGVEDLFEQISDINQKDILIAISFPRYTRRTVELMELAKKKELKQPPLLIVLSPQLPKRRILLLLQEVI